MSYAEIAMELPADTRFAATARMTVASLAAELDFGVDQIEQLQLAANELFTLLVEWSEDHGGSAVELRFRVGADDVEVVGAVADMGSDFENVIDPLTERILAAVVDEYEVREGQARIHKRRSSA